ncbi:MAG: hypothetical protein WA086_23385, partial [Ideonella sp.]
MSPAPQRRASWPALLACAALLGLAAPAQAGMLQWCDKPTEPTAQEQDRMLRFAAVVRAELIGSGQR